MQKELFAKTYGFLKQSIKEGMGKGLSEVKFGTAQYEMTKQLTVNVGVFSAFKNHIYGEQLVATLKDEEGDYVNFAKFWERAQAIEGDYQINWLQTEYNTAVRSARMASQWADIVSTKYLYPNLEYIISRATNRREDHEEFLVGTILPIDHPFWDKYYPPNGWGCLCSVRKTDKPIKPPVEEPALPPEFAHNPGKSGMIWDVKETGYGRRMKEDTRERVLDQANKRLVEYERDEFIKSHKGIVKYNIPGLGQAVLGSKSYTKNLVHKDTIFDKLKVYENLNQRIIDSAEVSQFKPVEKKAVKGYYFVTIKIGDQLVQLDVEMGKNKQLTIYSIKILYDKKQPD